MTANRRYPTRLRPPAAEPRQRPAVRTGRGGARPARSAVLGGWLLAAASGQLAAVELPELIQSARGGVVAVGTVMPTRQPRNALLGTGFAVGEGNRVITNAHVLPAALDSARRERLVVFSGRGRDTRSHEAVEIARDEVHDLAVLEITGARLAPLRIGDSEGVREGEAIAFIGYPVANVLGLYPATHRGIISAITPVAIPVPDAGQLTPQQIALLRDPYLVFQLDATAYPGNSGSPLFSLASGQVIGIINKVLVKGGRENALKEPSNITYAIPARHLRALLERAGR